MKSIITLIFFLTFVSVKAQQFFFETTNSSSESYGSIDLGDMESNYFMEGVYSNSSFPKTDGWEILGIDEDKYYYQKTGSSDYGKISIYDNSTNSITDYGYISDIFDDPSNWTLAGVDSGVLYFKSSDSNSQIVTYNGSSTSEFGYLNDFLAAPGYWTMRGVHDGKIYVQWIQNNTFVTTIKSWDGADESLSYKITDFYEDSFDADIFGVTESNLIPENTSLASPYKDINYSRGEYLRVFKLAISVTGGATETLGGFDATKEQLDDWLYELNDLYGRELALRFELVDNNDDLIFEDAETDPWPDLEDDTNTCTKTSTIRPLQEAVIDNIIGAGNYDMSHIIYDNQGGGCAGIGNLFNGATGRFTNAGRHELGHQLGQPHTVGFTNSTLNYEQGGGYTTQGGNGNPYLHSTSYHVSAQNLIGNFAESGQKITTNNTIPTIDVGADYTIPISTPFVITAEANDPDSDNTLTYVWDCMNPWYVHSIPRDDDDEGGLFKRLFPTEANYRYFPTLEDIIANNNVTVDEQLPTQPRTMDFRVTVNDNNTIVYNNETVNASGINSDDISIIVADAGPFVVTSQNQSDISYESGSNQEVTWDVNNTNVAPIGVTNVKITLSIDGGYTYPVTLLESTTNDGEATVTIPNELTEKARIKVAAVDNIFFDINTVDFQIIEGENNYTSIPALIQAEDYSSHLGTRNENTTDTDGGENLGYIDEADYLTYAITVPSSGNYTIDFRVASSTSAIKFDIYEGATKVGSVEEETTGGWQTWKTSTSVTVALTEGEQIIKLLATGGGWNINWLDFKDANVFAGVNLALNGTAEQSSNYSETSGLAELAIDGNTNGTFYENSVTHTLKEESPWWQVRLGNDYAIGEIKIWNRTDCCSARLSNFDVFVYNTEGTLVYKETIIDTPNSSVTINAEGAIGSRVRVKLKDTNFLSLAEVQVYGYTDSSVYSTKIEAEDYSAMSGVETEATSDDDTLNVSYIESGDWMDYTINIPSSGVYTINSRIATIRNNAEFEFQVNGSSLSTVSIDKTGGWQQWVTLNSDVYLTAGEQTLRIYASGNGFNINWIEITNESTSNKSLDSINSEINMFSIYPVPANSELNVSKIGTEENSFIEIINMKGSIILTEILTDSITTLDISALESGMYITRFYNGNGLIVVKTLVVK